MAKKIIIKRSMVLIRYNVWLNGRGVSFEKKTTDRWF